MQAWGDTARIQARRCFVDINVLVYLFDSDSPDKRKKARALL
jgi:predicted nucleic acid-binding protein